MQSVYQSDRFLPSSGEREGVLCSSLLEMLLMRTYLNLLKYEILNMYMIISCWPLERPRRESLSPKGCAQKELKGWSTRREERRTLRPLGSGTAEIWDVVCHTRGVFDFAHIFQNVLFSYSCATTGAHYPFANRADLTDERFSTFCWRAYRFTLIETINDWIMSKEM